MKEAIYILIILLFIGCSNNEKEVILETYPNGNTKSLRIYPDDKNKNNYKLKEYYANGHLEFESKVRNSKFIEYKKAYFENGNPKEIVILTDSAEFDFCCPDGFYTYYYENGIIKETHYKKNGLFEGLVSVFDSLGIKESEHQTFNDLKNGITKTYYNNGIVESIKEYKNDTLVGTVFYFSETGDSLKRYGIYKGKLDFPIKYWKKNGYSLFGNFYKGETDRVQWIWKDSLNKII